MCIFVSHDALLNFMLFCCLCHAHQALYDYSARYADELDLTAGSMVALVRRMDGDWYEVRGGGGKRDNMENNF